MASGLVPGDLVYEAASFRYYRSAHRLEDPRIDYTPPVLYVVMGTRPTQYSQGHDIVKILGNNGHVTECYSNLLQLA